MQTASLAAAPVVPTLPSPRPARAGDHRSAATALHTRGLVGALNAEWRELAPAAAPGEWAASEPALGAFRTVGEVVDAVAGRGQDDALRAVLKLARDGDRLAARTVLQAMLGAAVRLARRTLGHAQGDFEESLSRAVGALWQVIREYPVERRTCRPADGISLDVLAILTGAGRPRVQEVAGGLAAELGDVRAEEGEDGGVRGLFWAQTRLRVADACSDEQLVLLLAWGVRTGVLSRDDARLLLRLHSPAQPGGSVSCREVADELGLAHPAVRQRASRATRRLAAAVAEQAQGGSANDVRAA